MGLGLQERTQEVTIVISLVQNGRISAKCSESHLVYTERSMKKSRVHFYCFWKSFCSIKDLLLGTVLHHEKIPLNPTLI